MTNKKRANGTAAWVMELIIKERDAALLKGKSPDGDAVGKRVGEKILRCHRIFGTQMARFAIESAVYSWCVQLAGRACRQTLIEAAIGWNGEVVRQPIPERVSIPKRDKAGLVLAGAGTYPLWVDIPRVEYFRKLSVWERGVDERRRNVAVLRRGATVLEAHPDADTLREACKLDGQDVADFLIDESAI